MQDVRSHALTEEAQSKVEAALDSLLPELNGRVLVKKLHTMHSSMVSRAKAAGLPLRMRRPPTIPLAVEHPNLHKIYGDVTRRKVFAAGLEKPVELVRSGC